MTSADRRFMRLALGLSARELGNVWPNPAVGCVLVQGERVVGRGWTQSGGRPHAETCALSQAGRFAYGATAYTTLEPCSHHGKTPPCAEALVRAGVERVVVAHLDPDPRVNGNGIGVLKAAGIEVTTGVLAVEAEALNLGFLTRIREGRPMVTLKLATSFDGRIATATGESRWITGREARRLTHAMRVRHDAVLVGAGTVRADNASLTVRGLGVDRQPVRVVLSRRLDIPFDSQLARTAGKTPVWLCHGPDVDGEVRRAWDNCGARLFEIPVGPGRHLDLMAALRVLGRAGLTRVLCEGGGTLAASLLSAAAIDRLAVFGAGLALGAEGAPSVGALGLERLAEASKFRLNELRTVGPDTLQCWSMTN